MHLLPCSRVRKMQFSRMQGLTDDQSAVPCLEFRSSAAVERIPQKRMPDGGHMHADLVSPSRFQLAPQKRERVSVRLASCKHGLTVNAVQFYYFK